MKRLIVLLSFVIVGCVSSMPGFPGYISESVSNYDGTRQLNMEPGWLQNSSIKLSLTKNSKWPKNQYLLTVHLSGGVNIETKNSLHFNVDGSEYHFTSDDSMTKFESPHGSLWSYKSYFVKRDFLEKIVAGNNVGVKVDTFNGYLTGKFTEIATGAKPAFREFLKRSNVDY